MPDTNKCLWPQENRLLMQKRAKKARPFNYALPNKIRFAVEDLIVITRCLGSFYGHRNFRPIEKEVMYLFNGEGTAELADKYTFLNVCRKLGYRVPKQVLLKKSDSTESKKELFEKAFITDGFGFFLKPESGCVGRGIKIVQTREEALSLIDSLEDDYVAEETINIDKEFRYALYVDPDGNRWHMAFEKVRPDVVGDGKSKIWELIVRDRKIPMDRKITLLRKNRRLLGEILPKGSKVRLANIGVQEAGSYGKLPEDFEIAALDKFVPDFIADLEKHVGHKMPILCFDLGVTAPLNENLSFEEIKKVVTPFECQMPFSPYAHFKFMKNGFGPFVDFYRMLLSDMIDLINKRIETEKLKVKN